MSVFDTTKSTTTTLPSWFTSAQEGIATAAPTVYGAATDPSKTVASGLISNLNSQTANPFTTAISGLQTAQNANLKPWTATGAPDTSTPLGALFASQNAKLDQILPQITSQTGAGGIATGNYGSLRGQTAVDTARAGALTSLSEQQDKAYMDAMNQSIQAGNVLGNVGSQYGTTALNTATQEMLGGLPALSKYSDIINAMGPTTNRTSTEVSKGSPYENMLKGFDAVKTIAGGVTQIPTWLSNITSPSSTNWEKMINDNQAITDISADQNFTKLQSNPWDLLAGYDFSTKTED
jgi:hypothetical protein